MHIIHIFLELNSSIILNIVNNSNNNKTIYKEGNYIPLLYFDNGRACI